MCKRAAFIIDLNFFANVRGGPLGIFGCQMRLTRVELANGIIPRPKADHFSALRFQIFPSHAISHAFFAAVLGRGVRKVHCFTEKIKHIKLNFHQPNWIPKITNMLLI